MKKCVFFHGKNNVNNLFDSTPSKINLNQQWIELKKELYRFGIDLIPKELFDKKIPDLEIHLNAWSTNTNKRPKFLILYECEYIHPENSNFKLLEKYNHIFSWNIKSINKCKATKIQWAHPLGEGIVDGYKNRDQLITLFGSNRSLKKWRPDRNLYNERVKTIRWFEKNASKDFTLYGKKWNLTGRLPSSVGGLVHSLEKKIPFKYTAFPSWKGYVENKQNILKKTRFSIVYENVKNLEGYITEKIFDAFVEGNVPIYWGAKDIEDYIPKECFIDRRKFNDHEDLYKLLKNMPEEKFLNYQKNIKNFLNNTSEKFTCREFAKTISTKISEFIK